MDSAQILRAVCRRWYVALLGLALIAGGLHLVQSHPGVYSSQVDVVFLAPRNAKSPNNIQQTSAGLIATAGLVERLVVGHAEAPGVSASVPLTGLGVRDGYSIRLPSSSGQWEENFDRPVLDVQVAGPTSHEVEMRTNSILREIAATLRTMQVEDDVAESQLITTTSSPVGASIRYSGGEPRRAEAASLLLGLLLTLAAVLGVERVSRARRLRRRRGDASPLSTRELSSGRERAT